MRNRAAVLLCLLLLSAGSLSAGPISRVVAFGDSLTDNGNLFALTLGAFPPSPPYFGGRGSNGPVAVEYLADNLGVPLVDFAVYGATTGVGNLFDGGTVTTSNGLPGVLASFTAAIDNGFTVSANDLYVIMGGPANDFRLSNFDPGSIPTAVANQVGLAAALQAQGAQHIMVVGLPDMGLIPFVTKFGPGVAGQVSLLTMGFNNALQASLPMGVDYFDAFGLVHRIFDNAGAYGFTNTTGFCTDGVNVCGSPGQYFFWDDFHPTTRVHDIVGGALASAAVPEPATVVLVAGGLLSLAIRRRRA